MSEPILGIPQAALPAVPDGDPTYTYREYLLIRLVAFYGRSYEQALPVVEDALANEDLPGTRTYKQWRATVPE